MGFGKILVFTSAYNAEKTIARAIDSILHQTYQNWTYICLDNGSSDNTRYIIQDYAARDERVISLFRELNELDSLWQIMKAVIATTEARYYCVLDSDDEYAPSFLTNAAAFASNNDLDIVSTGYRMIDATSNELLKQRSLDYDLMLQGPDFEQKYTEYRGFTLSLWAKLYSVAFVKRIWPSLYNLTEAMNHSLVADSEASVIYFREARRAGVLGGAYYHYYVRDDSFFFGWRPGKWKDIKKLYSSACSYIASYGAVSKENTDFLQAIYLSCLESFVDLLKKGKNAGLGIRLRELSQALHDPDTQYMLHYNADPKFRNLAAREEYKQQIRDWILSQEGIEQYRATTQLIFDYLNP